MEKPVIYIDHNATTPVLPEVREVIIEAMKEFWGNPSSLHSPGRKAFALLENARARFAALIGASPKEIFFTSGGTESDNLAVIGFMERFPDGELVISSVEHPAVHDAAQYLANRGNTVKHIPVDEYGIIQMDKLEESLNEKVKLVSIIYANNEIGTIQPIEEIGEMLAKRETPFHSDAVQAFGKIHLNVGTGRLSLMSVSSHKIYGPKGCGALYVREGLKINPRTFGGSQERHIRTGTENLPAILGFVKAAEIACNSLAGDAKYLFELTETMYSEIYARIENVIRNGHAKKRIPGTLNLCFPGAETESVLASLDQDGVCASGGAACSSGSINASRTLLAIGRRKTDAVSAIRFSLGRENTKKDVMAAVDALEKAVKRIRTINK
jgi:cysteine desulfurase